MNTIYFITGPAGVGKSTVSKLLASKLTKSCLIEGDTIYHFVESGYVSPWLKGNQLKLFWKNSFDIIQNCLDNKFDVVFNYIISLPQITKIKKQFSNYNIKFVVLLVEEKTILMRDKLRPADCQMGKRCLVLLNDFKQQNFRADNIFLTDNLTGEQTANEIILNDKFYINKGQL